MIARITVGMLAVAILSGAAGCASTPSYIKRDPALLTASRRTTKAEKYASKHSLTWDKTKKKLEDRPWLSASREEGKRLAELRTTAGNADEFRAAADDLLTEMAERAQRQHQLALRGLGDHAEAAALDADLTALAEAERKHLLDLKTDKEREKWVCEMTGELPSKVVNGGRAWRMAAAFPLVPFLYGWIANHSAGEDRGPYPHEFENGTLYTPPTAADEAIASHLAEASEAEALAFYAPVVVQQELPDADYDASANKLGRAEVYLDRAHRVASRVNTDTPVVYSYVTHSLLAGEWHRQMNYQLWYPEHPPLASFDPEAGVTEGVLIRMTLDLENRPLLCETVFACGCFHRIFPIDALEKEATETFGRIVSGRSPLAKDQSMKIEAIIPQSMGSFDTANSHPFVYVYGGKHFAGAVEFNGPRPSNSETITYEMRDADELEALPLPDGRTASFFQRDGLVRGADRPEATMLWGTGLYHPGTPRIRGEHLIHFDQYDFDDPSLLEQLLRLPPKEFLERIELSPYARRGAAGPAGEAPSENVVPRANKKAFFCPC